jgi:hypothetical protein
VKILTKTAVLAGTVALMASPAWALPAQVPANSGTAHAPSNEGTANAPSGTVGADNNPGSSQRPSTTGPDASLPQKAKAYGKYCQDQSKKHVAGQRGTPFSKCVTDMAKLASGHTKNPRTACKDESKKHVDGQKGTPFSNCVSGGAKLLKDQAQDNS